MEKPMVSYWKEDTIEIYIDEDGDGDGEQVIILGTYDHKNSGNPQLAIGIHWRNYPNSRGYLSPCVLSTKNATALLNGLLLGEQDKKKIDILQKALLRINKQ